MDKIKQAFMNLLMPAVGKKTFLVDTIRRALEAKDSQLIATDLNPEAPAGKNAHFIYATPRLSDPSFETIILDLAQKHNITAVLPTRQQEFTYWTDFVKRYPQFKLLLSSRATIDICNNKKNSYDWLKKNNLPASSYILKGTNSFADVQKVLGDLPWFGKPVDGSASMGASVVKDASDYEKLSAETILQPQLKGEEYTLNCYIDRYGKCRVVIPHRRLEVTDGEVSVGVTVKNNYLLQLGKALTEALPGAFGPFCFQLFYDPTKGPLAADSVSITDLNARFGGGYPLCHAAGGNFVEWLIAEAADHALPSNAGVWHPNVKFVRSADGITISHTTTSISSKTGATIG